MSAPKIMERQNAFYVPSSGKEIDYPYIVKIVIEHAEELMICDRATGTSDPYVTLTCGGRLVGTTKVISMNRTKPTWNETFEFQLLSLRQKLILRVFDQNQFCDDVPMGVIEEDLYTVSECSEGSAGEICRHTRCLRRPDNLREGEGTLTFTISVKKDERSLFMVFLKERDTDDDAGSEDNLAAITVEIAELCAHYGASDIVKTAILESPVVCNRSLGIYSRDLVVDILKDCFLDKKSDYSEIAIPPGVLSKSISTSSSFSHATRIDFISDEAYYTTPVLAERGEYVIEIEFANFTSLLIVRSCFAMWAWIRALRAALKYWKTQDHADKPLWNGGVFSAFVELCAADSSIVGKGLLNMQSPFVLKIEGNSPGVSRLFMLDNALSIVVSKDYTKPRDYQLSFTVADSAGDSNRIAVHIPSQTHFDNCSVGKLCTMYFNECDVSELEKNPNNSLNFYVFDSAGKRIVGESILSVKNIFDNSLGDAFDESNLWEMTTRTILLDTQKTLKITLVEALNVPPHLSEGVSATLKKVVNNVFDGILSEDTRYCYISCSAVQWNGKASQSSGDISFKSKVVSGRDTFQWADTEFSFTGLNGLETAEFIRMDLMDNRRGIPGVEEYLGTAFIPIGDFLIKESEISYPLSVFGNLPSYMNPSDMGMITVRTQMIQNFAPLPHFSIIFESWLKKLSVFDTLWSCRCISTGDLDKPEAEVVLLEEKFSLFPVLNGIALNPGTNSCSSVDQSPDFLRSCQEKDQESSTILIPWNQIVSVDLITPSVISITAMIHRCFQTQSQDSVTYREANVEIFVTECPASDLYRLILERKEFFPFRSRLQTIISSCSFYDEENKIEVAEEVDVIPTVLLSPGAEVILDLDKAADELERKLKDYLICLERKPRKLSLGSRSSIAKSAEFAHRLRPFLLQIDSGNITSNLAAVRVTARRICRYRAFIATLFNSVKAIDSSEFEISIDEDSALELMKRDFTSAYNIKFDLSEEAHEDLVFNRINYLLDISETRIRDVILCGWAQRGGELERCLTSLVNGYYLEIVSNLYQFFESGALSAIKGAVRKKNLLSFLLTKDYFFSNMLTNALRPIGLTVDPKPIFSRVLKIDDLMNDYCTILLGEMATLVENTVKNCKSHSKEESSLSFTSELPWYPHKLAQSHLAITCIPEDISLAVVDNRRSLIIDDDKSDTFASGLLKKLKEKIVIASSTVFLDLSTKFCEVLGSRDWMSVENLETQDEYILFLSSVANDCRRVFSRRLIEKDNKLATGEALDLIERTYNSFQDVETEALDILSCFLFNEFSLLLDSKFYSRWLKEVDVLQKATTKIITDIKCNILCNLDPDSACVFIKLVAKKFVNVYLCLIRDSSRYLPGSFSIEVSNRLHSELETFYVQFKEIVFNEKLSSEVDNEFLFLIVGSGIIKNGSIEASLAQSVLKLVMETPNDSLSYIAFINSCVSVRALSSKDSHTAMDLVERIENFHKANASDSERGTKSTIGVVFSEEQTSLKELCLIPSKKIVTKVRGRKSLMNGKIVVAEGYESSSVSTHKIEVSNILGFNFPSINFMGIGKATSCIVVKVSDSIESVYETESQTGGDPVWESEISFNVAGFHHQKIIFEVYYIGIFQSRTLIGTVSYPLLGVDISKTDKCDIDTSCCPAMEEKLSQSGDKAVVGQQLLPSLEFSIKVKKL